MLAAVLLVAATVGIVAAVLSAGGEVPDDGLDQPVVTVELPAPGTTVNAVIEDGARLDLPNSPDGQISVLEDALGTPQARSYDGNDWELMQGSSLECSAGRCIVGLSESNDGGSTRTLLLRQFEPAAQDADRDNARFLLQASFGPTGDTIADLGADPARFQDWVEAQIALPATLHRVFYRQRVNQPVEGRSTVGRPRVPCEVGSRWQRAAFIAADVGKTLEQSDEAGFYELQVDGVIRHQESVLTWTADPGLAPFVVCSVGAGVGGEITFGTGCAATIANPAITFSAPEASRVVTAGAALADLVPAVAEAKVLASVPAGCALPAGGHVFAEGATGEFYMHTPRLVLLDNPVDTPVVGSPVDANCPSVPRTFVNEASCVVSAASCASARFESTEVTLDAQALLDVYAESGKYMYAVSGLPVSELNSPCTSATRWLLTVGSCGGEATSLDGDTSAALQAVLSASFEGSSPNPTVRDVPAAEGTCSAGAATGAVVTVVDNAISYCFRQAHPEERDVYDFSFWAEPNAHPGNREALLGGRPNPIKNFAQTGVATLSFPSFHSLNDWETGRRRIVLVGKLDETLLFTDLSEAAQTPALAAALGVDEVDPSSVTPTVTMSCGSPGEVGNVPGLGSRLGMTIASSRDAYPDAERFDEDAYPWRVQGAVWTNIALAGADQLRQRVAWVFAQVLVVSASLTGGDSPSEVYTGFYDIFVRHAFGNYLDMLREVSYSPLMGRMLSYIRSSSLAYTLERQGVIEFPDENYAREVMQLFSIGQFRLNPDGTHVPGASGQSEPSYDNDDIMSLARAWTGFTRQASRSNLEGNSGANYMDPMFIDGELRDVFPKLGPAGTYIGDGHAVCEELPPQAFLRKGARWRFLGASQDPDLQQDRAGVLAGETTMRVELNAASSALFDALCNAADPSSTDLDDCQWQPDVVLDEHLACDGAECEVDTVKVVMIPASARRCPPKTVLEVNAGDGDLLGDLCEDAFTQATTGCPTGCTSTESGGEWPAPFCVLDGGAPSEPCRVEAAAYTGFYFEYVRPACVHLPFYHDGRRIARHNLIRATCADPRSLAASEACCAEGEDAAYEECRWGGGERMAYASAQARCAEQSLAAGENRTTCDYRFMRDRCDPTSYQVWSSQACGVQVKVHPDGKVAIVHDVQRSETSTGTDVRARMELHLAESTENWFRPAGQAGSAPRSPEACKAASGCSELEAGGASTCLCDTVVVDTAVFSEMPSLEAAVAQLHVGSPALDAFDAGEYVLGETSADGRVAAYQRLGSALFAEDTVFDVAASVLGPARLLRNVASTVTVAGAGWSFRNPPTFHSFNEHDRRDAEYETEAVLEHLLWHPNTGPFVASSLIRHMVTSNPSPRYVQAVATAFREGAYAGIGSGGTGDLAATVAAVLLDAEARSPLLDSDPSFGRTREPLNKVVHFFRAMGMQPQRAILVLDNLEASTGQEPLDAPNVFSYFQQDYSPGGPIKTAGLVAPEAQLLAAPIVLQFLNALFSTIKWGLSGCQSGIGAGFPLSCAFVTGGSRDPDQLLSRGWLTFEPADGDSATAAQVVEELDLLLTAGRLDNYSRAIIEEEFDAEAASSGGSPTSALRMAQHLFLGSPQFHASNQCAPVTTDNATVAAATSAASSSAAPSTTDGPKADEPYKAIVYVKLRGGMDSFNALVPHSSCFSKDMFQEYRDVRGNVALDRDSLRQIDAFSSGQVCGTFGLHPALRTLQALYAEGDAVMLANTGVLVGPVTRDGNEPLPSGIFSHNKQQEALDTQFPQGAFSTGVLGRIVDELNAEGYSAAAASISGNTVSLVGDASVSPRADILSSSGSTNTLDQSSPLSDRTVPAIRKLNLPQTSIFGNVWADSLQYGIERSVLLAEALDAVTLETEFPNTGLGRQLQQVAGLIRARGALQTNRNAFFTTLGGFDSHNDADATMSSRLGEADDALEALVAELKAADLWEDVTIIFASEFGRTLTSNGRGTDHGWGGNYWMVGGSVFGGRVVGTYPDSLTEDGPLNFGRGRIIPTTSWDAVWNGVAQWFGVDEAGLTTVLPNRANFNNLFSEDDLFGDGPDKGANVAAIIGVTLAVATLGFFVWYVRRKRIREHQVEADYPTKASTHTSNLEQATTVQVRNPSFEKSWWRPQSSEDYA